MEIKENKWTTVNIMARRKLKRETEKASLFSIPEHKGLSVWISKKCIHGSRNGKMLAVGIKADDDYTIWIYDADSNRHLKSEIWQGQYLLNLYQAEFKKIVAWLDKQQATKNLGGE
ncbi:hypothetical protein [Spiroplasma sp. hyd1]|uniref:hypothetical protein n=1 Tax=Spiroplasma sp. hyd1 TaxID=1609976 RepID=UPI0018DE15F8|nr:hypothetical protein [Spiroplasma sp. hyd1]MBH8623215.1 hypothetical protein [Spiroplasma sp. hyd1]